MRWREGKIHLWLTDRRARELSSLPPPLSSISIDQIIPLRHRKIHSLMITHWPTILLLLLITLQLPPTRSIAWLIFYLVVVGVVCRIKSTVIFISKSENKRKDFVLRSWLPIGFFHVQLIVCSFVCCWFLRRLMALTVTALEARRERMPSADVESSDIQLIVWNVTEMRQGGEWCWVISSDASRLKRIVGRGDRRDVRIDRHTRITGF